MSRTRVIIFTVFVVAGIYDFAAEYVKIANVPTISYLFNRYFFQFSFWEFVVGLALGHLIFNRIPKKLTVVFNKTKNPIKISATEGSVVRDYTIAPGLGIDLSLIGLEPDNK